MITTNFNRTENVSNNGSDSLAAGGVASFVTRKPGSVLNAGAKKLDSATSGDNDDNLKKRSFPSGSSGQQKESKRARMGKGLQDRNAKPVSTESVEKTAEPDVENSDIDDQETIEMQKQVDEMTEKLSKSKERTDYWKRQSCDLKSLLDQQKSKCDATTSALEEKVEALTDARVQLQEKLASETNMTEEGMEEIAKMLKMQETLESEKQCLIQEIETLQSETEEAKANRNQQIEELQTALKETLGDLKKKLGELTSAKEALKRSKMRLNAFVEVVNEKTANVQVAKEKEGANAKPAAKPESKEGLQHKCDRREERITCLSEMVEKLVFKASVLSQTNSELQAKINGSTKAAETVGIKMPDKFGILEKMCLKRYKEIMKKAAAHMFEKTNEKSEEISARPTNDMDME